MKANEIVYIGDDEFDEYDLKYIVLDNFQYMIVNYENGGRDGSGTALALGVDGLWRKWELGHCSCYGPLEDTKLSGKFNDEEILELVDKIDDYTTEEAHKILFKQFITNKKIGN